MRRLTLILSDFYLPADAREGRLPDTAPLPALQWLLRFATSMQRIDDWRRWLARDIGASALAELSPAHLCARAQGHSPLGVWLATPVALEARLDHVRLADRGLLALASEERAEWRAAFAATFGPDLVLHDAGDRSFLLGGGPAQDVATTDPARVLDSDIRAALPSGAAAGELRRLQAEIEMWLHTAPLNESRVRARQRRVSALWLWGGGGVSVVENAMPRVSGSLHGDDTWLRALAQVTQAPVTDSAAAVTYAGLADQDAAVVELRPVSGPPEHALAQLEQTWFQPAREGLATGRLEEFRLVANDRLVTVHRKPGWRFWRRPRNWLESLAGSLA